MHYRAQRTGYRPSPGVIALAVLVLALVGAAFWIGPLRPAPAELELLASGTNGYGAQVELANAGTDGAARFPFRLALRNTGPRVVRPAALHVSIPGTFRLRARTHELEPDVVPGNPLVRYTLPLDLGELEPGATAELSALDTLWLEPQLVDYYCTTMSDSIPEFAPAPRLDPAQLADLRAFYSVADERSDTRQTGVLRIRLDPAVLARPVTTRPSVSRTEMREPFIVGPVLGPLTHVGTRTALCGDPQQPLELFTSTYETPGRGRLLVVYLNGAPRKQLYDLNRDSIIEYELWDPDADGRMEARRAVRYAIPSFLLPERRPEEAAAFDSFATDPAWQQLFHDTTAGPFRFLPDSLVPPSTRRPAAPVGPVPDSVAPVGPAAVTPRAQPDTAWVRRFHDTDAGPFRFAPNPPPRLAKPPEPPPRPRPRRNEPLGTPIPYPRPSGN